MVVLDNNDNANVDVFFFTTACTSTWCSNVCFNRFDDEVVAVLVVVLLRVLDWVVASLYFCFLNWQCWLLLHDDDDDDDDNDHVHVHVHVHVLDNEHEHEHEHDQYAYYFDHYHVHYVDYQHVQLESHHHHHHHDHYHLIIMITTSILNTIISTIIFKIIKLCLLLLLDCLW